MSDLLREALYQHDELADLPMAERRLALRALAVRMGIPDTSSAVSELADEIDGFGCLTSFMDDEAVTDVLVNGCDEVWIDRSGSLERTGARFRDEGSLRRFVERMFSIAGVRIDRSHPVADARLADGSRIHAVLPPIAPDGPLVSIRRFPARRFELADLVRRAMLSEEEAGRLRAYVSDRKTIVIGGRTGTGKSTLLDALLRCIPPDERIVTIEELPELCPGEEHRVSLIARGQNVEGKGAVSLDELVRASLRMRPDRLVIGEVRGVETLAALEAMATGHEGSMLTVHARCAEEVPQRLLALALRADSGAAEGSLRRQIFDAIDVVVHLERNEGRRRVAAICDFG